MGCTDIPNHLKVSEIPTAWIIKSVALCFTHINHYQLITTRYFPGLLQ